MTFRKIHTVTPQDIDDLQHVNNITYLQWILEAAQNHWVTETDSEFRSKYGWVVLSHYIEYKKPAYISDQLTIETWAESESVLSCKRHTLIKKNDEVIVVAETRWCPILMQSLKPTRILPMMIDPFTKG